MPETGRQCDQEQTNPFAPATFADLHQVRSLTGGPLKTS